MQHLGVPHLPRGNIGNDEYLQIGGGCRARARVVVCARTRAGIVTGWGASAKERILCTANNNYAAILTLSITARTGNR